MVLGADRVMIASQLPKNKLDWHDPEARNQITVLKCVNSRCGLEYVVYQPRAFPDHCERCRCSNFITLYRYGTH